MPNALLKLFKEINQQELRVRRPANFLFFCGGAMTTREREASSLRHYLLKERKIQGRIKASIILAEEANQIYRDSTYFDLITFEEDIARISALILVIAESAGSLAELGAFASTDVIRRSLAVLIRTDHFDQNSFIRFGPVEKLLKEDRDRVGVYPWRTNKRGLLVKSSIQAHIGSIVKFINMLIEKNQHEYRFGILDSDTKLFFVILWVLYLGIAITITQIHEYINSIWYETSQKEIRNKLYCMQMAGWICTYSYENKTYWYAKRDLDPFSRYSFEGNVSRSERDAVRRKTDVVVELRRELTIPTHVRGVVSRSRISP